ncbi:MAG: hypothetical protein JNL58_24690 [Planctomyces sp.]|nr:hypothetical protein [Planctomyces sp.]
MKDLHRTGRTVMLCSLAVLLWAVGCTSQHKSSVSAVCCQWIQDHDQAMHSVGSGSGQQSESASSSVATSNLRSITVALSNLPSRTIRIEDRNATFRQVIARYRDQLTSDDLLQKKIAGDRNLLESLIQRELTAEEAAIADRFHSFDSLVPGDELFITHSRCGRLMIHEEVIQGTEIGGLELPHNSLLISIPFELIRGHGSIPLENRAALWPGNWSEGTVHGDMGNCRLTVCIPGLKDSMTTVDCPNDAHTPFLEILREKYGEDEEYSRLLPPTLMMITRPMPDSVDVIILPAGNNFAEDFFADMMEHTHQSSSIRSRLPYHHETSAYLPGLRSGDTITFLRPNDLCMKP